MSKQKKIIIWTKGLDDLLKGEKKFNGGIAVQMTFWAKTFQENGWEVYSISRNKKSNIEGIHFLHIPTLKKIGIIFDFLSSLTTILKIKPDLIIRRSASRNLFFVALWAKLIGVDVIVMGAHDTDFDIGKELIKRRHDKILYRKGIHFVDKFIVQNKLQKERLKNNYGKKNVLLIPNIWKKNNIEQNSSLQNKQYILWVANFRKRKRPEWFINLSKQIPEKKFIIIGGPGNHDFFNECKSNAEMIDNLTFMGSQNFWTTNSIFSKAKLFICTSESEGFPNTFLQAWSNNIPVITTFDPSDTVRRNQLGFVRNRIEDIVEEIYKLDDQIEYERIQHNIEKYFKIHHNANFHFKRLINKFCL